MTKGEFISQYHLLCKGFRYEATEEQTDAWYRKVQQYALQDWADAVSTLLCGARFPLLDPALAALVGACDGDLAVGVLIDAIADLLEVDAAALRADLLPRVRELVFTGFLRLA